MNGQIKDDDEGQFIKECRTIAKMQNDLKYKYPSNPTTKPSEDIDDSYWKMNELLKMPNSSMACSQTIIFVLFHTLSDIIKDIANNQKYDKKVTNSFLENNKNEKFNVLDIGCGSGLIGQSIVHFYPYFDVLKKHFGDNFDDKFNLYGFDHSKHALNYGISQYPDYFNKYDEIFAGDINDRQFIEEYIKKQSDDGLYDIIIASDVLFQEPINGIPGIESIKKSMELLKPGGF